MTPRPRVNRATNAEAAELFRQLLTAGRIRTAELFGFAPEPEDAETVRHLRPDEYEVRDAPPAGGKTARP